MSSAPPLTLVKLGGSLITDKRRPGRARRQVITRLAAEIATAAARRRRALIVGHGSGSFGHAAASRHAIQEAAGAAGIAEVQASAATLHRLVVGALLAAGAAPFSLAPSSFMSAAGGRPVGVGLEPLLRALELGLLPVTYGDVVLDRRRGASICSTETVFRTLAAALRRRRREVDRVLWVGATAGVLDAAGRRVESISAANLRPVLAAAVGAAGTDVTGGMRHRIEAAMALARLGIESWILDGRRPGQLERAIAGAAVPATRVPAAGGRH